VHLGGGTIFVVINQNATGRLFVAADGQVVLEMNGVIHPCGTNEDAFTAVNVNADRQETFLIDQGGPGGPFTDDRPWSIAMSSGEDVVGVLGTPGPDRVRVGQVSNSHWIDLDGDGVEHHALADTEFVGILSRRGHDRLAGQGTPNGVLDPSLLPLLLNGGRGQDIAVGGSVGDSVAGGRGDDRLRGKLEPDLLIGGKGTDVCKGGLGADTVASCEKGGP
jgi:Ca2+-binding RTX toxin-like protein